MSEAHAYDRDLVQLSHRFIAETCEFLTENWDVRREWWPLRSGRLAGAPPSGCGARTNEPPEARSAAANEPAGVHVVSLHVDPVDAEEIGLAGTRLFLLVPVAGRIGMTGACTRTVIVEAPSDDVDDAWPIWVPETITPPAGPVRLPAPLQIAG